MLVRLALVTCTLHILALPSAAQQWVGAIKFGGALTTYSGDLAAGSTDWGYRVGIAGGGAIGYDFGNGLLAQLDITYVRKGATTDVMQVGIPTKLRSDLTYLMLPLSLQFRFFTGGRVHPRLFVGPAAAFQLEARIHLTTQESSGSGRNPRLTLSEVDESIERVDLGAVAGAALEIEWGSQRILVEARYYAGLQDITKPHEVLGDTTIRNNGIVLLAGFVF